jgi:hypothetical protein
MGTACSTNGGEEECIQVGKPVGKRPVGRPGRMWVNLRETGWNGMVWIDLAQDRDHWRALVNAVMNLRVP